MLVPSTIIDKISCVPFHHYDKCFPLKKVKARNGRSGYFNKTWLSKGYPASRGYILKSSLYRQPFKSVQKSEQINLKNRFIPVLDRFRVLHESCIADQSCLHFFIPWKLASFDNRPNDIFCLQIVWRISCMHDRKLNSCRQRLLFARQLTQWKCSLSLHGSQGPSQIHKKEKYLM